MTDTDPPGTHFVKVKRGGHKRWWFLRPDGTTTTLRGRALRTTAARAARLATDLVDDDTYVDAKAVPIDARSSGSAG
jgi:hypothetical protein